MTTQKFITIIVIGAVCSFALLPWGNAALAAWAPQVQTNAAVNIQDFSATFSGNLYDLGGDYSANVWFQYGVTAGYGYETAHMNQSYTGAFSQNVYGLNANTTYHFRAVVQNGYATSYGQDVVFTTGGSSSNFYAQTNAATNMYNNQATLNGYVNGGTYSTLVWFQYGTSANYGYTSNTQSVNYSGSVSQNISNLAQNTTYHYRVLAQNNNGQIVYGQDVVFTTGGGNYCQPNQASILEGISQIIVLLQQILASLRYSY